MHDYKSLCAAATICATLVYTQTHSHIDSILISLGMNSSASWAINFKKITNGGKTKTDKRKKSGKSSENV